MDSDTEENTMTLPPVLDLAAAGQLQSTLLTLRGRPTIVNASEVQRMGGLCLQVLLAARNTWATDGHGFTVIQPSAAFSESTNLMAAGMLLDQPNPTERT